MRKRILELSKVSVRIFIILASLASSLCYVQGVEAAITVLTQGVTNKTTTSITLNGELTSVNIGITTTNHYLYFEYNKMPLPAFTGTIPATPSYLTSPGLFHTDITGLTPGTTYRYRAVVKIDGITVATGYYAEFTTNTIPPSVATVDSMAGQTTADLSGNLTSLGSAATVNVSFQYGTTTAYGDTTPAQAKTTTGYYNATLTGLVPGTTYHFRAKADGGATGTVYGGDMTFTTTIPAVTPPSVTTNAATNITSTSATLNGYLNSLGTGTPATVRFEYGLTTGYGSYGEGGSMSSPGAFNASISGLIPGATYHFRAVAITASYGYGADVTFDTPIPTVIPLSVTTNEATVVNGTQVYLAGNLTSMGSATAVIVSFEWGTTIGYGNTWTSLVLATITGTFTSGLITGLTPGTTYHFRAKADGGATGIVYGDDKTFTTSQAPPTTTQVPPAVETYQASLVGDTLATLNGNLTRVGTSNTANVSFEYGTTTNYGSNTPSQTRTAAGSYSANITGLTPGTTYHFRAKADGGATGIVYGDDKTFTTPPPATAQAILGDLVWLDKNANGIQDEGEPGILGITVQLHKSSDDSLAGTAITDNDGKYSFTTIPGSYYLIFLKGNYTFSPQDQGFNDAADSDVDNITGKTKSFVLNAGQEDLTWDCGLYAITSISIRAPEICTAETLIAVEIPGDKQIDRVEFIIDGTLELIDYSRPFNIKVDTTKFINGPHVFTAKVLDDLNRFSIGEGSINIQNIDGREDPKITITYPSQGNVIAGEIRIIAEYSDDSVLSHANLYIDGCRINTWFPEPGIKEGKLEFLWNSRSIPNGNCRLAIDLWDMEGNTALDTVDIRIDNSGVAPPSPYPDLIVTREVTRHGNYFTVKITVHNIGDEDAYNVRITDYVMGYQPVISDSNTDFYKIEGEFNLKTACTTILIGNWQPYPIPKQQSLSYSYNVVPVLQYPDYLGRTPAIGTDKQNNTSKVSYERKNGKDKYEKNWGPVWSSKKEHEAALKTSDYLIATSPYNLLTFNNKDDVNVLLSSMAELASLKNGVLGFVDVPSSISRKYEMHDGFAVGDVWPGGKDEIVIADRADNQIHIFQNLQEVKRFCVPTGEFEKGDQIALGNLHPDKGGEIVIADCSEDTLTIVDTKGNEKYTFHLADIQAYDGLAVGNLDGDGMDEIVIGDRSTNKIDVYKIDTSIPGGLLKLYFSIKVHDFQQHDGLSVGDILDDEKEEIVYASRDEDKVYVFDMQGKQLSSFPFDNFREGDGLAVANIGWDEKDEIIVAEKADYIDIYDAGGNLLKKLNIDFEEFDGFAAGNVIQDPRSSKGIGQVLVADRSEDNIDVYPMDRQNLTNKWDLDNLINEGSLWASQLTEKWTKDGYLLIVGETEIIPAFYTKHEMDTQDDWIVKTTDLGYANTAGDPWYPELNVGRMIGENAQLLNIPIQTSIDLEYDRRSGSLSNNNSVFLISGCGEYHVGFEIEAYKIDAALSGYLVNKLEDNDFKSWDNIKCEDEINKRLNNANIVIYTGHGNPTSWITGYDDDLGFSFQRLFSDDVNNIFKRNIEKNHPFVFANACSTGAYSGISDSVAETFLKNGSSVYIGATSRAEIWASASYSVYFFNRVMSDPSYGYTLKKTKLAYSLGLHTYFRWSKEIWIADFQLFGDPKIGPLPSTFLSNVSQPNKSKQPVASYLSLSYSPAIQGPIYSTDYTSQVTGKYWLSEAPPQTDADAPTSIDIVIPDYEVTKSTEGDFVSIPEGIMLDEPQKPLVPLYVVSIEYPRGVAIQNVSLANRSGLVTDVGLKITNAPGAPISGTGKNEGVGDGWWPTEVFTWQVHEQPDGATDLSIVIAPFFYNSTTTESKFFKNYSFKIDYIVTTVEINDVIPEKYVYTPGEKIVTEVTLNNSGSLQDIVVSAEIEEESTGQIVSTLPGRTLRNLIGKASLSLELDSKGFASGYYDITVKVLDTKGNILDRHTETVQVGFQLAEIRNLVATRESNKEGNGFGISMVLNNIGTDEISGNVIIKVQDLQGTLIQEFNHEFENLAVDESKNISQVWDISNVKAGTYRILAYALYGGDCSVIENTEVTMVSSNYLWLILMAIGAVLIVSLAIGVLLKRRRHPS